MTKKANSIAPFILGLCCVFLIPMINCCNQDSKSRIEIDASASQSRPEYTGRESCRECHDKEYNLFIGSDHDQAMDVATEKTVLGDFNNATFTHFGVTSEFYTYEGKYFVKTEGTDGELKEHEVKYTFGIRPLQQYLVEFPDGALQCLPLCWDSRPEEEGGQKWFHIYGDERIPPDDMLYWTRITQNWNYMCAECHSTNLKKNFDAGTDSSNHMVGD